MVENLIIIPPNPIIKNKTITNAVAWRYQTAVNFCPFPYKINKLKLGFFQFIPMSALFPTK